MLSLIHIKMCIRDRTYSDPLVVIDGQYASINALNALNPSEIEALTVLKDAASTAQYGSKGCLLYTSRCV